MCKKFCYSKKEAQEELNLLKKLRNSKRFKEVLHRKEKRIYYCDKCCCWHLSSEDEDEYELNIMWHTKGNQAIKYDKKWEELLKDKINEEHMGIE